MALRKSSRETERKTSKERLEQFHRRNVWYLNITASSTYVTFYERNTLGVKHEIKKEVPSLNFLEKFFRIEYTSTIS